MGEDFGYAICQHKGDNRSIVNPFPSYRIGANQFYELIQGVPMSKKHTEFFHHPFGIRDADSKEIGFSIKPGLVIITKYSRIT
jgi:hypothetical protein